MVRCVNCAMMPDRKTRWCHAYKAQIKLKEIHVQMSCPRYSPKYRVKMLEVKK